MAKLNEYQYDTAVQQFRRQFLGLAPKLLALPPYILYKLPAMVIHLNLITPISRGQFKRNIMRQTADALPNDLKKNTLEFELQISWRRAGIIISSGSLYESVRSSWRRLKNRPTFPIIIAQDKTINPISEVPYPCATLRLSDTHSVVMISEEARAQMTPEEQSFMLTRELVNNTLPNRAPSYLGATMEMIFQHTGKWSCLITAAAAGLETLGLAIPIARISAVATAGLMAGAQVATKFLCKLRTHLQDVQEDRNALYLTRDLTAATSFVEKSTQKSTKTSRLDKFFAKRRVKSLKISFKKVSRYPVPLDWAAGPAAKASGSAPAP